MMTRAALSILFGLLSTVAMAADAPEPYSHRNDAPLAGKVPACSSPSVLRRITSRFHETESKYWHSDLKIVSLNRPAEIALRPWGPDYIERRYCRAHALTSDGVTRQVHYSIGDGTSGFGVGYGVEWCVTGLDRNLAYAPDCKMAGP